MNTLLCAVIPAIVVPAWGAFAHLAFDVRTLEDSPFRHLLQSTPDEIPRMVPQAILSLLAFTALYLVPGVAALDFGAAQWIWTNEISGGNAPVGTRAFRKDFTPPLGKTPVEANILIAVDNGFTLYVNGGEIGTGGDWRYAESFCVALRPCLNVFAVTGVNTGGPAGVLATIQITYDDGSTSTVVSDTTWRASTTVPAGYEQLSFDANRWTPAIAQGGYGVSPWGQIAIPSTPPVLSPYQRQLDLDE
ncbi:hypothetical protein MSAN_01269400 [Mycena sanguinolenta]|uniref:Uncharacterized protein n=1 Tax=Mycena sanguinolenta TaxID=230812 RepID=A0A8H6YJW1_9AGAR|nr:hypothetical protein MSAN_01269400 [Mycena sanguinolenta]